MQSDDAVHTPAQTFCTIYSYSPGFLYVGDMYNARLLIDWLGVKAPPATPSYPSSRDLPDACAYCRTVFGFTIGGRLRAGCHRCPDRQLSFDQVLLTDGYALNRLSVLTGYSSAWLQLFIAAAIYNEELNGYRDTRANAVSSGRWVHSPKFEAALS